MEQFESAPGSIGEKYNLLKQRVDNLSRDLEQARTDAEQNLEDRNWDARIQNLEAVLQAAQEDLDAFQTRHGHTEEQPLEKSEEVETAA